MPRCQSLICETMTIGSTHRRCHHHGDSPKVGKRRVKGSPHMAHGTNEMMSPSFILVDDNIWEVSVYKLNATVKREIKAVFSSSRDEFANGTIYMIPTIQKAKCNLLDMGKEIDCEKDRLLEYFVLFGNKFVEYVKSLGYWADYCDPCSGLPMHSQGNVVYPEILGLESIRKLRTVSAGPCRVALHSLWGPNMYPATIFSNAPASVLVDYLNTFQKVN